MRTAELKGPIRISQATPLLSLLLLLLPIQTSAGTPVEPKQSFVEIAYLTNGMQGRAGLSGYDTDNNGLQEVIFPSYGMTLIYEHIGNNQYQEVLRIHDCMNWTVGDPDHDGLSDIVVQTFDSLEIFESPAPDSYPTRCVWQWQESHGTNTLQTTITDLDQDGTRELMVVFYSWFICMLENAGDNAYTEVFRDSLVFPPYGWVSEATPGDFDLDGKMEYVASDHLGNVWVFENVAVGVDSFTFTWQGDALTITAYENASANDMDRDGKPEFVIGGGYPMGYTRFVFTVFETTGDDNYELVWCDSSLTSGLFDHCDITCGDVDGDSIDEMLFSVDENGIFLYKCAGPDSYERIWEWHTMYGIGGILIYDLNQNGYGEIVVSTPGGTWIFEKELPGIEETNDQFSMTKSQLMQNVPNPFGRKTLIRYHLSAPGHTTLRVYDVTGRLVASLVDEEKAPGSYSVTWNGENSDGRRVLSGVYFYRLQKGGSSETAKMVVLR